MLTTSGTTPSFDHASAARGRKETDRAEKWMEG